MAELILSGVRTQTEIARRLGVDQSTVAKDCKALDALYQERAAQDVAAAKGEDLARLDELLEVLYPIATLKQRGVKGWLFAVDRVMAVLERRAKLLGLDAPTKVQQDGKLALEVVNVRERLLAEVQERRTRLHALALPPQTTQEQSA